MMGGAGFTRNSSRSLLTRRARFLLPRWRARRDRLAMTPRAVAAAARRGRGRVFPLQVHRMAGLHPQHFEASAVWTVWPSQETSAPFLETGSSEKCRK